MSLLEEKNHLNTESANSSSKEDEMTKNSDLKVIKMTKKKIQSELKKDNLMKEDIVNEKVMTKDILDNNIIKGDKV